MSARRALVTTLFVLAGVSGLALTAAAGGAAAQSGPQATGPVAADAQSAALPSGLLGPAQGAESVPPMDPGPDSQVQSAVDSVVRAAGTVGDLVHLLPLVAGYSRVATEDPLNHETRAALYETVERDPGVYLAELARATDTPVSTVRYHVRVLERAALVERRSRGGRSHVVPADADTGPLTALDGETQRTLLATLDCMEPATGADLAAELDLTKSTVSHHLSRLAEADLVAREPVGRTVENRLTDRGREALALADPA